jgi:hypothetical protein
MEEQGTPPPAQQGYPQPPPGYWYPHPPWQQHPQGPGNGRAIAGFALGLGGLGLLVVSFGLLAPISAICGGLAIFFGTGGKRAIDRGETQRHGDLAKAGLIIGMATVVLAILAIVVWVLLITMDISLIDDRGVSLPDR